MKMGDGDIYEKLKKEYADFATNAAICAAAMNAANGPRRCR